MGSLVTKSHGGFMCVCVCVLHLNIPKQSYFHRQGFTSYVSLLCIIIMCIIITILPTIP